MVFKQCCCCFRLRTGTVVLGWLGVVAYTFYTIFSVIGFLKVDYIADKVSPPSPDYNIEEWKLRIQVFLGCLFVVSFINLIAAFMLILGVIKENRYLLLPWLIGGFTSISFTVISLISSISVAQENISLFVVAWVAIAFEFYLWLCVYSLFKELRLQSLFGASTALLVNKQEPTTWNYQAI